MKQRTDVSKITVLFLILLIIITGCSSPNENSPVKMRVLVPAYFEPTGNGYWAQLATEAAKRSGIICAIANVYNGPGTQFISSYQTVINTLRSNGGKCLGYVYTLRGARDINTVKAEIKLWFDWYKVDGIFVDEQSNEPENVPYYQELYQYIKTQGINPLVIGNPGSNTIESYITLNGKRSSDVFCVFEADPETFNKEWSPEAWYSNYNRVNFGILIYNVSLTDWQQNLDRAYNLGAGWIYITNDKYENNPWDTLPPYFSTLCAYVRNSTFPPLK